MKKAEAIVWLKKHGVYVPVYVCGYKYVLGLS